MMKANASYNIVRQSPIAAWLDIIKDQVVVSTSELFKIESIGG
jgi:hypothetical protein